MKDESMNTEQVLEMLSKTSKGAVRQTKRNCLTVLENDPMLKDAFRYNILTERTDIVKSLGWKRYSTVLTDTDMNHLYLYFEDQYDLTNEKNIRSAIQVAADNNQYHPIRDYLNNLEWDGTERIRYALNKYLGSDTNDLTYESLKLFMLGAINRVFHPGCKFEIMLCLVGGQGAGKSTFFRFLALKDEWFTDDLKRLDDENVYRKLQGHWIIEMSEMIATANAKSIEEIKSFISRQKETYKVPYETYPADRLRQCVFGGTSNNIQFLPFDRSGNRRFIPVMTDLSKAKVHILDNEDEARAYIDQLWAEAMNIYLTEKSPLKLSKEMQKMLESYQQNFMSEDTTAGIIQAFLDDYKEDYVCTMLLYREALGHMLDKPKRWETNEISDIMNSSINGWKPGPTKRFNKYGTQRSWERIKIENANGECKQASENEQLLLDEFTEIIDNSGVPF